MSEFYAFVALILLILFAGMVVVLKQAIDA